MDSGLSRHGLLYERLRPPVADWLELGALLAIQVLIPLCWLYLRRQLRGQTVIAGGLLDLWDRLRGRR